jgi:peptidoglycan/LPS O-acetylase OafA/YrhL
MTGKRVFETMNGLRGVAAVTVVAYHWLPRHTFGLENGFLAVDFFFVLSGFVIAHSYEQRLRDGLSLKDFFLIRLIRFYPLYLLGLAFPLFTLALSFAINGRVLDTRAAEFYAAPWTIFMLPAPPVALDGKIAYLYILNGPAWSLFFELVVNILYAMTLRFWTDRRLIYLLIGTGSILALNIGVYGAQYADGGWAWGNIHVGFLRVFYSFPAGVLIYRLYKSGVACPPVPSTLTVAVLLLLFLLPSSWGVPFDILIGFPLLVALAARTEPQGLLQPIFASLGTASYAIYALHQPMHEFLGAVAGRFGINFGIPADIILIFITVPVCVLIDRIYDSPVRKYLTRRFLHRGRQRPVPAMPV